MRELRIGLVGLGWVAGAHIAALRQVAGARITAVSTRKRTSPAELEREHGIPLRVAASFEDLLADPEIDVIDICTPPHAHAEQAVAAARAGKHLIIEKPIALDFEQAKAIRDAIRRAGVRACVCFSGNFSPYMTRVRELVREGVLGTLHYGEVDYFHAIGPWYGQFDWNVKKAVGGSSLLSAGCHALDKLMMFMGDPVEEVVTYGTRSQNPLFARYEYPTSTTTLVRFAGGKDAKVGKVASVIDSLHPYTSRVHLVGSKGAVLDNRIATASDDGTGRESWRDLDVTMLQSGDVKNHAFRLFFQAFVDSLAEDREMPAAGFAAAFEVHRAVFAADRSLAERRPVKLAELGD